MSIKRREYANVLSIEILSDPGYGFPKDALHENWSSSKGMELKPGDTGSGLLSRSL